MEKGDYVLATKYRDGDPQDQWCVGFYQSMTEHNPPRFNIVDAEGNLFRGNGFRRVKKISKNRGKFIIDNAKKIETSGKSIWWLERQKMNPTTS